MRLLTDENVPDSVGDFFQDRGHELLRVRDHFGIQTNDTVIARGVANLGLVFVSWNRKHFQGHVHRFSNAKAGLIAFRCDEARGRQRAQDCIELVEFCYEQFTSGKLGILCIEIGESYFRVHEYRPRP